MTAIDPHCSVPARRDRVEGGLSGANIQQPGEMRPVVRLEGTVKVPIGYTLFCPGCGERLTINTDASSPMPRFIASGDLDAGTLTLSPSVHHKEGCGWHGFCTDGQFVPVRGNA